MRLHAFSDRHTTTAYIKINTKLCRSCWKCIAACLNNVIGKIDFIHRHAHIDRAGNCKGCRKCVLACPSGAILPLKVQKKR